MKHLYLLLALLAASHPAHATSSRSVIADQISPSGGNTTTTFPQNVTVTGTLNATVSASSVSGVLSGANLPYPSVSTLGGVESLSCSANQWLNSISTGGAPACTQPAFSNLSGSVTAAQLPVATPAAIGGVQIVTSATSHQWVSSWNSSGVPQTTQPAFSDISSTASSGQLPVDTAYWDVFQTWSQHQGNSYSGSSDSAHASAQTYTGTPYSAGTATSNKPELLLEDTGNTSASWSTHGTYLGVNAISTFTGNLLDLQLNGTSKFSVLDDGSLTLPKYSTGILHSTSGAISSSAVDLSGADATGTLAAARMPALTGDITTSSGAVATTMASSISGAKTFSTSLTSPAFISSTANPASAGAFRLADTDLIKWRNHGNSADVSFGKDTSDQLSWAGTSFLSSSAVILAAAFPALTGDITTSAGALGTTIAANAVTNAKMATMAANTVKANVTGSTATPTDVTEASAATASSIAYRDANANVAFNREGHGYQTTNTSACPLSLTAASQRIQYLTGSTAACVVNLPATNAAGMMGQGDQFEIHNISTQSVTVKDSAGTTVTGGTISAAALGMFTVLTSASPGTWDAFTSTSGAGGGTVTSVTFTGDGTVLSSTPSSAVTTTGTVTGSLKTQTARTFLQGPLSGSAANPTFAALTAPTVQKLLSTGTTTGYLFTISTSTTCAVNDTYTNNGNTYTVLGALSAQTGQVLYTSGASAPTATGTLTRSSGSGTASVTFTAQIALATYTTPTSPAPLYIRVRVVGGGGGGSGGGSAAATAGTAGGTTVFGTSLIVANGGAGGNWAGGTAAGGTASLGSGPIGIALQGGAGNSGFGGNAASLNEAGQPGASSALGGAGAGNQGSGAGVSAIANTGSGGGGGGGGASGEAGGGGAAGGFADALVAAPSATYVYAIGNSGGAGGNGTGGGNGGAGASGLVLVEEFYQ